jgi:hypothetical protein
VLDIPYPKWKKMANSMKGVISFLKLAGYDFPISISKCNTLGFEASTL